MKANQKGFVGAIVLLVIAVLLGAGYFIFVKSQEVDVLIIQDTNPPVTQKPQTNNPSTSVVPTSASTFHVIPFDFPQTRLSAEDAAVRKMALEIIKNDPKSTFGGDDYNVFLAVSSSEYTLDFFPNPT